MNNYIIRIIFLEKKYVTTDFQSKQTSSLLIEYSGKNEHDCKERFLSSSEGEKYIDQKKYDITVFKKSL